MGLEQALAKPPSFSILTLRRDTAGVNEER
jgi:hypothetical protein